MPKEEQKDMIKSEIFKNHADGETTIKIFEQFNSIFYVYYKRGLVSYSDLAEVDDDAWKVKLVNPIHPLAKIFLEF